MKTITMTPGSQIILINHKLKQLLILESFELKRKEWLIATYGFEDISNFEIIHSTPADFTQADKEMAC